MPYDEVTFQTVSRIAAAGSDRLLAQGFEDIQELQMRVDRAYDAGGSGDAEHVARKGLEIIQSRIDKGLTAAAAAIESRLERIAETRNPAPMSDSALSRFKMELDAMNDEELKSELSALTDPAHVEIIASFPPEKLDAIISTARSRGTAQNGLSEASTTARRLLVAREYRTPWRASGDAQELISEQKRVSSLIGSGRLPAGKGAPAVELASLIRIGTPGRLDAVPEQVARAASLNDGLRRANESRTVRPVLQSVRSKR